jgi:hypothetical protein
LSAGASKLSVNSRGQLSIAVRLGEGNNDVLDYFLLPTSEMAMT